MPELKATRSRSMHWITTRAYYPGTHHLEIKVNGESLCMRDFDLLM